MIKLMKRYLPFLVAILLYGYIAILPKSTLAQETSSSPLGAQNINLHTWTQISSLDIVSGLTCQIIGYDPANAKNEGKGCVAYNQEGKLVMMEKAGGGAVAFTGNLIATMYANPPASGVQYLADLGKNLGFVSPAYAAVGTGFSGLSPILPIWKAFRNIAYLFFTIIFIVVGFAIMFRVKISPQAVVTIQSALPRMIIALILVTFSYAIAGFLIDLMYVLMVLLITALKQFGVSGGPEIGPSSGFLEVFTGVFSAAYWVEFIKQVITGTVLGIAGVTAIFGVNPTTIIILGIGGGLIVLVFSLIILFVIFKLFIELLKAYIGIIFGVIFAPLQIMLGVLPGVEFGFGAWIRNLLANILVFPAVAVFLFIAGALIKTGWGDLGWAPPMMTFPSQIIPALIGFGVLLMVYKVPEMVKEALQVKPFRYGAAIGEAMGVPVGPLRGIAGGGIQGYAESLPGHVVKGAVSQVGKMIAGR